MVKAIKRISFLLALLFSIIAFSQSNSINYKAIVKDGAGALVANALIQVQFNILDGAVTVYQEQHVPTTDSNGIIILNIGEGIQIGVNTFSAIDWSSNNHFLNVLINTGAGLIDMGTTGFKAVPYALHAKTASETDPSVPVGTTAGEIQYWNGTAWVIVATPANEFATLQMISGVPTWTGGTPQTTIVEVTNPTTGRIWMDRNLGAVQAATSSADAASYGDLYQWGRGADGHQIRTSGTTVNLSSTDIPGNANFILAPNSPFDWRSPQNTNLWQGVNGVNNPCPAGYRLPTEVEWAAELASWSTQDDAGAFASPLKLPVAGIRDSSDGLVVSVGSDGYYWSSTLNGSSSRLLTFLSGGAGIGDDRRARGFSVRCIKD